MFGNAKIVNPACLEVKINSEVLETSKACKMIFTHGYSVKNKKDRKVLKSQMLVEIFSLN